MTPSSPLALVLGATGGVGGATANALRRRGWRVRALYRDATQIGSQPGIEGVVGDALVPADVRRAAEGASVIVHAVNPPGYRDWHLTVLPMLDATLAAARAVGARVVLPGTVYNYGRRPPALVAEDAPQVGDTRKGAIRVELERRLEASGLPVLILRCGDFFGGSGGNSWFGGAMVHRDQPLRRLLWPGAPGVGHAFAYLPDVAETIARLLDREAELPRFARFHFAGHWFADGRELLAALRAGCDGTEIRFGRFPWWAVGLARPFVPLFNEIWEMRYLWRLPLRLDNRALVDFLGAEPHTPAPEALRAALADLGSLPAGCVAEKAPAR